MQLVQAGRRSGVWGLAVVAVAALAFAAAARAESPQVRLVAADQAAARAIVLQRSDLSSFQAWQGGFIDPKAPPITCPGFDPKQSDLVLTGRAASQWSSSGVVFQSTAQIYASPEMVQLDWQRSLAPGVLSCLRAHEAAEWKRRHGKLVSLRWLAFPQVVPGTRAIQMVFTLPVAGRQVSLASDIVMMPVGRTEIALTGTSLAAVVRSAHNWTIVALARVLASRASA